MLQDGCLFLSSVGYIPGSGHSETFDTVALIVDDRGFSIEEIAVMDSWEAVGVVAEGQQISLSGLNPWSFDWRRSSEPPIELPHPQHRTQWHLARVFEIDSGSDILRFAAAEVSAGVWASYQPGAQ